MVLDGVGAGALPDAVDYGDDGASTLENLSRIVRLRVPRLQGMGLGNIAPLRGVPPAAHPVCLVGRLAPRSAGKDTTVGHWEQMGLVTSNAFPTYPRGFPDTVVHAFEGAVGMKVLGNKPASGTAIIAELGEEHLATGRPIVYTSADSVFQIAAHVDKVPLEKLYEWCRTARRLLRGRHAVARVIARPFAGAPGAFVRTSDRRDFSLEPPADTYLDLLAAAGHSVLALGKVCEIFAGRGVTRSVKVGSNAENLAMVAELVQGRDTGGRFESGLLFTNLVDFDMAWGHRNDPEGFATGLTEVDAALPSILGALGPDDRLILTADHGVDPTTPSTDHSREFVPFLMYPRPEGTPGLVYEGGFSDVGATTYEYLTGQEPPLAGEVVTRQKPTRGWRTFTATLPSPERREVVPVRLGSVEVATSARWLATTLGMAPRVAILLGSGLTMNDARPAGPAVPYDAIPFWPQGTVRGHPKILQVADCAGRRVCLLQGRVHEYEGFDLSEVQMAVRTLARWGVKGLVLSSASGAVSSPHPELAPVVIAAEVIDCHYRLLDGRPARLPATDAALVRHLGTARAKSSGTWRLGMHASVPGPQYETPAELGLLRRLGADTVSMSPAAELRAAHDCGLRTVVTAVVVNAGDTTHEQVLAGAVAMGAAFGTTIAAILATWPVARDL
jgi:phosphopentomutase